MADIQFVQGKKLPVCRDINLSTNSWKENIMADIQFVQGKVCPCDAQNMLYVSTWMLITEQCSGISQ